MSSTKTALSRQVGVGRGVKASGVGDTAVAVSVGRVSPGFVGGRVEVTNRTGASVGVFAVTLAQAVSRRNRSVIVIFFVMPVFLWTCKVDGEIASIGSLAVVGITDAHVGDIRIQDLVTVGGVAHPP